MQQADTILLTDEAKYGMYGSWKISRLLAVERSDDVSVANAMSSEK